MTDPTLSPPPAVAVDLAAASTRLLRAAGAEAEIVYCELDSPLGALVAAATPTGLARLAYRDVNGGTDAVLARLAERLSPRIVCAPERLDPVRRELDEYFAGRRRTFELPVDLGLVSPFGREVLTACAQLGYGQTTSYAGLAAAIGRPRASRATGGALGANPVPIVIPCHRVLRSGGGLGGYTGGLAIKEHLLGLEAR